MRTIRRFLVSIRRRLVLEIHELSGALIDLQGVVLGERETRLFIGLQVREYGVLDRVLQTHRHVVLHGLMSRRLSDHHVYDLVYRLVYLIHV